MCTAIFAVTPSTARFTPLSKRGAVAAYMPLWGSSIWMKSQPAATSARHSALTIATRSEEHTSELQSPCNLVCRLLLEKKKRQLDSHQRRTTAFNAVFVHVVG